MQLLLTLYATPCFQAPKTTQKPKPTKDAHRTGEGKRTGGGAEHNWDPLLGGHKDKSFVFWCKIGVVPQFLKLPPNTFTGLGCKSFGLTGTYASALLAAKYMCLETSRESAASGY